MHISNDLNNCTNLHVVSVISSFDCNGHIVPLYIRINGESLKIHKSVLTHESTFSLLTFKCEVIDHNQLKPLRLNYHVYDLKWSVSLYS